MCGISKNELKNLLNSIEKLRRELHDSVKQGRNMLDPFVIKISQDLDGELNKYYRLIKPSSKGV